MNKKPRKFERVENDEGTQLSARQRQIAELAASGYPNRDIASALGLTEQIVKNVMHSVFDKLGVWNRVELTNYFLKGSAEELQLSVQRKMEAERLVELRRRKILDTAAERVFDELATLCVKIFEVPIALVAMVDSDRVWFKSSVGLEVSQVRREITLCHHTVQQSQVFCVADAHKDTRFVCNPLVAEVGLRFYAAAPIVTSDGYALGVVCIVDRVPREFSEAQLAVLPSLARIALEQIELRVQISEDISGNNERRETFVAKEGHSAAQEA